MISQYKHGLKGMTYILGSVCSDGVTLVADRKVTLGDGTTHVYEDKLFSDIRWMVVGSSGISGLFEKFRERLGDKINAPNWENTIPRLTTEIEVITRELNTEYREVLGGQVFDVLLGAETTTTPVLKYIHPVGFAEGVRRYKVIGHGEPYGSYFLKQWWRPNMTMLDVAELGFFVIKCIQECELDNTVGIGNGYPQVWMIPNQGQIRDPHPMLESQLESLAEKVLKRLTRFRQIPWQLSSN